MRRTLWAVAILAAVAAAVTSCGSSVTESIVDGDLRETSSVRIDSSGVRVLVATLTLENVADAPRPILWGEDCFGNGPLDVRMFRGSTLVWESSRVTSDVACPTRAIQSTIAAHGSASFEWRITLAALLGDSLPAGTYSFTVQPTLASPLLTSQSNAGVLSVADPIIVPPGTNLDGTWTGTAAGLSLSLQLAWTSDSVHGRGTYSATSGGGTNCAAPSLHPNGTVSLTASRTGDVVIGSLALDGIWSPPMSGHLRAADSLDAVLHSVDSGSCSIALRRVR